MLLAALVTFAPSAFASEQQEVKPTEAAKQEVVAKEVTATEDAAKKIGLFAAACALPGKGIDFVASWGGAQRVAKWLGTAKEGAEAGSIVSFFAKNEKHVSRSLALLETAVIVAAAYKAYQTFFVEEDDMDGDEYDAEFAEVFASDEENN